MSTRTAAMRVAYQGEPGAFGEAAVIAHFGRAGTPMGAPSFARAVALLLGGRADAAVLPIRNSSVGPVTAALAAIAEHADRLEQVDEVKVPVQHALHALPGASLATVTAVGSHPVALAQCARFFAEHPRVAAMPASDTAGAARQLAALVGHAARGTTRPWYADVPDVAPESLAAIASVPAGARYGLVTLARDIQDQPDNATYFAVLRCR